MPVVLYDSSRYSERCVHWSYGVTQDSTGQLVPHYTEGAKVWLHIAEGLQSEITLNGVLTSVTSGILHIRAWPVVGLDDVFQELATGYTWHVIGIMRKRSPYELELTASRHRVFGGLTYSQSGSGGVRVSG